MFNLCDENHFGGNKAFTSCKKFLVLPRKEKGDLVRSKKRCLQCLDGSTRFYDSSHHCNLDWLCQHESHQDYNIKLHFLLCTRHADDANNLEMLQRFKDEVLTAEWQQKLLKTVTLITCTPAAQPNLAHETDSSAALASPGSLAHSSPAQVSPAALRGSVTFPSDNTVIPDAKEFGSPVFLQQPVLFKNHVYNFFFDTGCSGFVSHKTAVDFLPKDC